MPPEHDSREAEVLSIACPACLARSRLLALLSARIEHAARDLGRLLDLLSLDDEALIGAIGGRRREELRDLRMQLLESSQAGSHASVPAICAHHPLHRKLFAQAACAPSLLHVEGDLHRLDGLLSSPVVALVGASQASDYGMQMAASFARSLARSGIGVISSFTSGIPAAVHLGVLEAKARPLAVLSDGSGVSRPARLRRLREGLVEYGSALSEMPPGFRGRRWSERAAERIIAAIASLVILLEADRDGQGMAACEIAIGHGTLVGALPGRVTSPGSRGPHSLLRRGAHLIASPQDALDLVYGLHGAEPADPFPTALSRPQQRVIERIGAGVDTLGGLCAGPGRERTLIALSEAGSMGLVAQADGGRYLPRISLDRLAPPERSLDRLASPDRRDPPGRRPPRDSPAGNI